MNLFMAVEYVKPHCTLVFCIRSLQGKKITSVAELKIKTKEILLQCEFSLDTIILCEVNAVSETQKHVKK